MPGGDTHFHISDLRNFGSDLVVLVDFEGLSHARTPNGVVVQSCESEYLICGGLLQSRLHGRKRFKPQTQAFCFRRAGFTRVSLGY